MSGGLLALGFVNAALLPALGLVALPIIIHWLLRRRYRHAPWAAMRFLLDAERETRRRIRLEQWLLIALRCLIMALLVLLVTRPFSESGRLAQFLGASERVARYVVIDDSASMQWREGTETAFSQEIRAAQELIASLAARGAGGPLTVLRASTPQTPIVAVDRLGGAEAQRAQEELGRLEPTATRATPAAALTRIADSTAARDSFERIDVCVFSDFQRDEWAASDVAEALMRLREATDGRVRVLLAPTSSGTRRNLAVASLTPERAYAVAGLPLRFTAEVANFGDAAAQDVLVQWAMNGEASPAAEVGEASPGEPTRVETELLFAEPGFVRVSATIAGRDGMTLDDACGATIEVRSALSVLIVDGEPSADPVRSETHLLHYALAPPGPFASGMNVVVIDPDVLEAAALDSYDCVLLCNVGVLTRGTAEVLRQYVQDGGGLGLFLGDRVDDPARFNELLFDGVGLAPARLEDAADAPAGGVALVSDVEHPVTLAFRGDSQAAGEYVRFRRYVRCRPPEPQPDDAKGEREGSRVLAHFDDAEGTPALIERGVGRGRVVLFTSSADLEWNNWAASPDGSYVVTMLELTQYLARRPESPLAFTAGEPLTMAVSFDRYEPDVLFKAPSYPRTPAASGVLARDAGGEDMVRGPIALESGAYVVELTERTGVVTKRSLSVNVQLAESDLRSATHAELERVFSGTPHVFVDSPRQAEAGAAPAQREWWRWIAFAALALLLLEQTGAWWFGRLGRARQYARQPVWGVKRR